MILIFFFQNVLNLMHISEIQLKIQQESFVFAIMAFQIVARNSPCSDGNTCHRWSMCEQTVLRFEMC